MAAKSDSTVSCPPELLGIAHYLDGMEPAARSAAAGILWSALSGAMLMGNESGKPPLTAEQQAVIDHLREHGVTSAEALAAKVGYDERTIKRWCGPDGAIRAHGVCSTRKGYVIGPEKSLK